MDNSSAYVLTDLGITGLGFVNLRAARCAALLPARVVWNSTVASRLYIICKATRFPAAAAKWKAV